MSAELDAALADGDARRALDIVEALGGVAPERELAVWILAGHVRAVRSLLPRLDAPAAARARAFLDDPATHEEPPAGADYAALDALRAALSARGRVRAAARVHLAMAEASPRPDWRWLHVEHAGTLARVVGDPRLDALVIAHEALRDADFGEDDDALERIAAAITLGLEAGEPRALALAERARAIVEPRLAAAPPDMPAGAPPDPEEEKVP
ncbi:MAG: hypothetical protein IT385_08310 [Deltaproteobacteria bacterium]|nr:hypothetical protein [Deltaproteobacteria bacterium]